MGPTVCLILKNILENLRVNFFYLGIIINPYELFSYIANIK